MAKAKVKKSEELSEDTSSRFKIMYVLIKSKKPMKLAEIWKQANLSEQLVSHHLKKMIDEYLVLETDDGTYICQPFLQDEMVVETLDALMEAAVRIVFQNMEIPETITARKMENSVQALIKIYIHMFGIE